MFPSYRIHLHFFLSLFGISVLVMTFFTVIKSGLRLEGAFLLYPYAIGSLFFTTALPYFAIFDKKKNIPKVIQQTILLLTVTISTVFLYHVVVLEEEVFDVLYTMRFYFGMFILFYGFVAFLFWLDIGVQIVQKWIVSLTGMVISLSFVLAALEIGGLILGKASPEIFWWIREGDLADIARHQSEGITGAIRAYGLASNPSVLGGFSLFLVIYYYSMVAHALRSKNLVVLGLGIITVFLSGSGMGLFLLIPSLVVLLIKHPISSGSMSRGIMAFIILTIGGLAIFLQTDESGRLTLSYFERFSTIMSDILEFFWDRISRGLGGLLLGPMNLFQFNKQGAEPLPWGAGEVSYYDFAIAAFVLEVGVIGAAAYFISFLNLIRSAFPRDAFVGRWSFMILIISSFHYPVVFWVCSQVMAATILSAGIYIQRKKPFGQQQV